MAIPESQFETWARQGAVTTAKATHESIRNALTAYNSPVRQLIADGSAEIYLQGSYKNDTNIRGDSDVDIVAELNATFYSNLTEQEKQYLRLDPAVYTLARFRAEVLQALQNYLGSQSVVNGNKAITVRSATGRLEADVLPCAKYRTYRNYSIIAEGITFFTQREGRQVINFPKLHYDNGVAKHSPQQTNGWYKPTVRIFKNARTYLVDRGQLSDSTAPSYLLESFIYNAPNNMFGQNYVTTFCSVYNWLDSANLSTFVCQNRQLPLFGPTPEQWSEQSARVLLQQLINLWNNWY
jgi:hypothetical protein